MATRLIETPDGILIEVKTEADEKVARSIKTVEKGLEQIGPLLAKACDTMSEFWTKQVDNVDVEQVVVEFGLGFELGGRVFIAEAKGSANVSVTATLKKPTK